MQKLFCISERATVRKGEYPLPTGRQAAALPRILTQLSCLPTGRALRVECFLRLCPGVNTLYFVLSALFSVGTLLHPDDRRFCGRRETSTASTMALLGAS